MESKKRLCGIKDKIITQQHIISLIMESGTPHYSEVVLSNIELVDNYTCHKYRARLLSEACNNIRQLQNEYMKEMNKKPTVTAQIKTVFPYSEVGF